MHNAYSYPLLLPKFENLVKDHNSATWQYYRWPFRDIYRYKLRMILGLMRPRYNSILDLGTGSGILIPELKSRSKHVIGINNISEMRQFERFDCIVCGSFLEFGDLESNMKFIDIYLKNYGDLIVASPMDSWYVKLYFSLIGNYQRRHSMLNIKKAVAKQLLITNESTWKGLYFSLKARKL